ncbi:unnamed protein product [Moneuplotes crassus]|uniref:Uncharacterized protein n=1 Tax=Euplotes crassus TaxID=5936 RepID=A0AAD1XSE6_EUPCR|nr:unnamed protein product [Moneuplotes crassus]
MYTSTNSQREPIPCFEKMNSILDQEIVHVDQRASSRGVQRHVSNFSTHSNSSREDFTFRDGKNRPNCDIEDPFRPEPEITEMKRLREKVERLEKACKKSTKIWKRCETKYNAYLTGDNKENVNSLNFTQTKIKPTKFAKGRPKAKIVKRPGSAIRSAKSLKSSRSKSRNLKAPNQGYDRNDFCTTSNLQFSRKKLSKKESQNHKLQQEIKRLKEKNKKWKNKYNNLKDEHEKVVNYVNMYLAYQQQNY